MARQRIKQFRGGLHPEQLVGFGGGVDAVVEKIVLRIGRGDGGEEDAARNQRPDGVGRVNENLQRRS